MNFSQAEGAEQFEIACEFDGLPETLVQAEAYWAASGGLPIAA